MRIIHCLFRENHVMLRSRLVQCTLILLLAVLLLGFVASFSQVQTAEQHLNRVSKDLSATTSDEYSETVTIDMKESIELVQSLYESLHPDVAPNYTLLIIAYLGVILVTIIGAHLTGQEFSHRTAAIRAAHDGWSKILATKLVLLVAICVFLSVVGFVIGRLGGYISWPIAQEQSPLAQALKGFPTTISYWQQILFVSLGLSFYGLLGMLIALITRSRLAGMLIGIAIPYVEMFIPTWWIPYTSYANLLTQLFRYNGASIVGEPNQVVVTISANLAWLMLSMWFAVLAATLLLVAKRQTVR